MRGNSASGCPPSMLKSGRGRARLDAQPFGGRQCLRQQSFVLASPLAQFRIDDEQAPGRIPFQLIATPRGDQFELVFVIFGGGNRRGTDSPGALCDVHRAQPPQRFDGCMVPASRSRQQISPAARVRVRQPGAQRPPALFRTPAPPAPPAPRAASRLRASRRERRAERGMRQSCSVRIEASNARASPGRPLSRRNSRSSAHSAPGGSSRSGRLSRQPIAQSSARSAN